MPAERAAQHVGEHAAPAHQMAVLEDHAQRHPCIGELPPGQPRQFLAGNVHQPGGGTQQAGDTAQQGGFAAAVVAEHHDQLAGFDGQVRPIQRQPARSDSA